MPRVLELFAKRGLVPSGWRSAVSGADQAAIDDRNRDARARPRNHRLHRRLSAPDRLGRSGIDLLPGSRRRLNGALPAMSFRDHIARCNNYDPARVVPLFAGADRIGLVRRDNAEALRRFPEVFAVAEDKVALVAQGDAAAISRAVDGSSTRWSAKSRSRRPAARRSTSRCAGGRRRCFASTGARFRFSGRGLMASI